MEKERIYSMPVVSEGSVLSIGSYTEERKQLLQHLFDRHKQDGAVVDYHVDVLASRVSKGSRIRLILKVIPGDPGKYTLAERMLYAQFKNVVRVGEEK